MVDRRYLNWKNKIGYGAGDIAGNVIYAFLSTFMMFYLTESVGMKVGIVGALMALSKLFDGATDLFFGILIDRTHTRMGKARPWMLYGYVGCTICLAAIFMIPSEWGENARYAYFFLAYTMLNAVFFTANNVAYATLTALITKNTSERVQLGCIRFIFAFATTMIIQGITMDAVANMGGGASAWKRVAVIYAILGLVANTLSTFSIKEMQPEELYKTDWEEDQIQIRSYTLTEGAKLLLSNKYYLMICGICFLSQLSQSALNMGVYYMKYVLGDEGMLKSFSLFANVPLILGLVVTPWFVKKLRGMYKLNIAGYVLAVLGRIAVMISAYTGSVPGMLAFTAVAALGTTPLQGGMNALIASCSEYTFLSKKTRIDGTMYSCSSFGIKLGASVGTAISGFLMASSGYVENAAVQTSGTISMLHFLYLWLPIILNIGITYLLTRLHVEKANAKILASRFNATSI